MFKKLILLLILCTACTVGPVAPEGAIKLDPPIYYSQWWFETEQCSGRTKPFRLITWWEYPGDLWTVNGYTVVGQYAEGGHITIARPQISNRYVVTHEMLHGLGFNHPGVNGPPYPWPFDTCN